MKSRAACRVAGAQRFERGVNEHADVADRELGDFADFLIAEIVLKFELQHFLLPRRKRGHDPKEKSARFLALDMFVRRGTRWLSLFFENFLVEISHALFLSANVERAVAADGEEPFGRSGIGLPAFAALQLNKSLLHDIPRPVAIAQNASGILQKGQFEAAEQSREVSRLGIFRPRA